VGKKYLVLGAGAWGTTMAQVLADANNEVTIWGRNEAVVNEINTAHTNLKFLPDAILPAQIKATSDIGILASGDFDRIVLAVPAQTLRGNLLEWKSFFPTNKPIISTLKGIEAQTCLRMTEVLQEIIGIDSNLIALVTGPNLAGELCRREPAGAVIAGGNSDLVSQLTTEFTTPYFLVYPSDDLVGCELAGAVKSVIALAVGMAVGLGYGANTQSMIITRGLNEVARFGESYGSKHITFLGLAGVGDLVVSCGSGLSRNRTFGEVLGKSGKLTIAQETVSKTVEGVASAHAVQELAHRVGTAVPIIEAVSDAVSGRISPAAAMARITSSDLAHEDVGWHGH
jgi:glycerol-3-phosphate dehydrogenase (NAD(P)+)